MRTLTKPQQDLIDEFNPYGMWNLLRRLPVEEKTDRGVLLPRNVYDGNRYCELVKIGSGVVADNRQFIAACEAQVGDLVSVLQFEDKIMIDPSITDHFLVKGQVIEGVKVNKPWPLPFEKLPPRLQKLYKERGYA